MSELPPHLRAFVAVRVPDDVIAQVTAFQQQLKPGFRAVSWTRPDAMHLTLQFLGNISSGGLPALTTVLKLVATRHGSFSLALGGAGAFSNRVLWAGMKEGAEPLKQLAEAVGEATKAFADHHETREFNAHLTLGRLRAPMRGASAILQKTTCPFFPAWQVHDFELIRSELSPKGSRYTTLGQFELTS
jgi:2'-5' RNA ligase